MPAVPMALGKAGLKLEDMDFIQINEAFAVQYLAAKKQAIICPGQSQCQWRRYWRHPSEPPGALLLLFDISPELQRRKAHGLVSLCIGAAWELRWCSGFDRRR